MIVSVVCFVGMKRSQESVSLQSKWSCCLFECLNWTGKEEHAAVTHGEEMAKHERRRADAEKIRADAAETRAGNEKARADSAETRAASAEAQVKEVETEKMGIEWTNLSFRCYHQHSDNYKQVSDMRRFDLYIPYIHVHV